MIKLQLKQYNGDQEISIGRSYDDYHDAIEEIEDAIIFLRAQTLFNRFSPVLVTVTNGGFNRTGFASPYLGPIDTMIYDIHKNLHLTSKIRN